MRISDWSSDVCSSDLIQAREQRDQRVEPLGVAALGDRARRDASDVFAVIARGVAEQQPVQAESKAVLAPAAHAQRLAMGLVLPPGDAGRGEPVVDARSEEHTSELQ